MTKGGAAAAALRQRSPACPPPRLPLHSALHPTACTLHPTPDTRHPAPCTTKPEATKHLNPGAQDARRHDASRGGGGGATTRAVQPPHTHTCCTRHQHPTVCPAARPPRAGRACTSTPAMPHPQRQPAPARLPCLTRCVRPRTPPPCSYTLRLASCFLTHQNILQEEEQGEVGGVDPGGGGAPARASRASVRAARASSGCASSSRRRRAPSQASAKGLARGSSSGCAGRRLPLPRACPPRPTRLSSLDRNRQDVTMAGPLDANDARS